MNACLKLATCNELTATRPSAKVSHVGVQPERKEKTQIFQLLGMRYSEQTLLPLNHS